MAPPVEAKITRALCLRAASSTLIVPITLTLASPAGSSTETRTSACAARWKITSGFDGRRDRVERLPYVVLVQRRAGGDVFALPVREIVDDVHLIASREQPVHEVRADEAGPAGDDRPHARILGRRCL